MLDSADKPVILVGHNIKFDLKHLFHRYSSYMAEKILGHPMLIGIWDTGIFEYLNSGMTHKFPSLAVSAKKWDIEDTKIEEVSELFASGKGADHVDPELLRDYLGKDLKITRDMAWAQYQTSDALLPHMFVQGWATVAYTRMENIGIPLSEVCLRDLDQVSSNTVERLEGLLTKWIYHQHDGLVPLEDCKPTNRALSSAIFNVPGIPVKKKVLVGKYKNGKPKYNTVNIRAFPACANCIPAAIFGTKDEPNPSLGWPTSDAVLDKIVAHAGETSEMGKVCLLIKEWRKASKIVGTYTGPMLANIERRHETKAYHTINNVVTSTGRTSSSNPNGQNMPPEIRTCVYVNEDHPIVSFDFSQLELCIAAQLSGDPMMHHDVWHSDVHFETGKNVMGWKKPADMDKDSRRKVKGINFGIIYGGGVKTLSEQTGVPENLVQKQIDSFKTRYIVYTRWQEKLKAEVRGGGHSPIFRDGEAYYLHDWVSPTGRKYSFRDTKRPWDGKIGISPSAVVNYPVQGTATGDIVPLFIAVLHGIRPMLTCHPFLAVHDSVTGVQRLPYTAAAVEHEVKEAELALPGLVEKVYNIKLNVPLKLDVEITTTWT